MNKKNKIIYVISDAGTGGGQVHLLDVLKNINKEQFLVQVICPPKGHYVNDFIAFSDEYHLIDFNQNIFKTIFQLRKVFKKEQPDIIHNHLLRACLLGGIIGLQYAKKVLNHLHSSVTDDPNANQWKNWIYIKCNKILNQLGCDYIAVSNYNKRQFIDQGIKLSSISVLYNGVDHKKITQKTINNHPKIILKGICIARLAPQKGIFTLLKIAEQLQEEVIFQIVGDGSQKDAIKNYILEHKIKNVQLLGFQKDVQPFLKQADFFILTSEWESMGIVIVEAMACGLPVIASRTGGIIELIEENKGGYLCEIRDVDNFVKKIKLLNPNLLKRMGEANIKRYKQQFTVQKMIQNLGIIYNGIH